MTIMTAGYVVLNVRFESGLLFSKSARRLRTLEDQASSAYHICGLVGLRMGTRRVGEAFLLR